MQIDMLDSTPLSHKADKALESSLPIFDESGNLAHSLATFMSFIASDNLAKNVHYMAHTNVCARTACLLDSALLNNQTELESSVQVDCHADKSARNDDEATQTKSPCDSKILELESGLFEPRAEIRLGGLSHKRGDEIHDSSPKAESLLKAGYAA